MTSYTDKGPRPAVGKYHGFDHIEFWVGNARQAASYYCARFGFQLVAYRGLETGSRDVATHVVRQNKVLVVPGCPSYCVLDHVCVLFLSFSQRE